MAPGQAIPGDTLSAVPTQNRGKASWVYASSLITLSAQPATLSGGLSRGIPEPMLPIGVGFHTEPTTAPVRFSVSIKFLSVRSSNHLITISKIDAMRVMWKLLSFRGDVTIVKPLWFLITEPTVLRAFQNTEIISEQKRLTSPIQRVVSNGSWVFHEF